MVKKVRLEQMKEFARTQGLRMMAAQRSAALTERDAEAVALDAQRWARKPARKSRVAAK